MGKLHICLTKYGSIKSILSIVFICILLIVQAAGKNCNEKYFECDTGHCIAKRYACDGFYDCPDGSDEKELLCGNNTCESKVNCSDGRCISKSLCCYPRIDDNCEVTYVLPCCKKILKKHNFKNSSTSNESIPKVVVGKNHPIISSTLFCAFVVFISAVSAVILIYKYFLLKITRFNPTVSTLHYNETNNDLSATEWSSHIQEIHFYVPSDNSLSITCNQVNPDVSNHFMLNCDCDDHAISNLEKCPSYSEACLDNPPLYEHLNHNR